ncbi:hypothetical protein [Selenomonas sp.]|uniref:hypothetical protein n=1 Tax=Selenomonas sp. TaxID=2053611 RepID=UPI0025D72B78|nr:hypothetical protein [Selenomonas sp.]MCI6282967.1 hypothetical protein [Selenomonas sp.]
MDSEQRKALAKQGVEKVIRRRPASWRANLASYVLLVEHTDKLLAELALEDAMDAFPESADADGGAKNEAVWLAKDGADKTLHEIGLTTFLRTYRVNDELNEYAKLRKAVTNILRPRNFVERVRTRAFRAMNLRP